MVSARTIELSEATAAAGSVILLPSDRAKDSIGARSVVDERGRQRLASAHDTTLAAGGRETERPNRESKITREDGQLRMGETRADLPGRCVCAAGVPLVLCLV